MDQVFSDNDVIITKHGCVGCITLNRPRSLNALNLDMIRLIAVILEQWRNDHSIKAVYMEGAGERAFCAGGDIKHFYKAGMDYRRGNISLDTAMIFFQEEYDLNRTIFHYPKPLIAHMHGITMGGGFGLAGNARYRIVSPDTKFAMPEAKIGFFPDVGSMYHLKSLNGNVGLFLALTGNAIRADDMLYCGLAEYLAEKEKKEQMLIELHAAMNRYKGDAHDCVQNVLNMYMPNSDINKCSLAKSGGAIEKVFSGSCVADIMDAALDQGGMVKEGRDSMLANSPLSMSVAYNYYYRHDLTTFDDIIKQDLLLAINFASGRDFYAGIRAAVIDKDKSPLWEFKTVKDVKIDDVKVYFM